MVEVAGSSPVVPTIMSEMMHRSYFSLLELKRRRKAPRFDPIQQEIFQYGNQRGLLLDVELLEGEFGKGPSPPDKAKGRRGTARCAMK